MALYEQRTLKGNYGKILTQKIIITKREITKTVLFIKNKEIIV